MKIEQIEHVLSDYMVDKWLRDRTRVSTLQADSFLSEPPEKSHINE